MLLRKYSDSHCKYFTPGQPWTAKASQIIDLLSAAHSKSLEELLAQQQEHGIIMDRPSSSQSVDDSAAGSGAVLAKFFSLENDETEIGDIVFGSSPVDKYDNLEQWFEDFVSRDAESVFTSTSDFDGGTGTAGTVANEEQLQIFVETETVATDEGSKDAVVAMVIEKSTGSNQVDEELMTLDDLLMQISDDMMLPSVTAAEITKIKFDLPVEIKEVHDQDWYYASLPKISATEKGKAPLEEADTVKGNPAREMVELIYADMDFLVQMRDQVMQDVVEFFHSFSINKLSDKLSDLASLRELAEKEKLMLSWAETDSLEPLSGDACQPWTAMASQIIDLLSAAHSKSLEELLAQQQEHGIIMDRPSSSQSVDDSAAGSGAVLAQFFSLPDPPAGDIVVNSSAVDVFERLPNDFCNVIQHGRDSNSFVVYRSPSPQLDSFQEADSSEPNVQLALVPTASAVDQDEQLYIVQSPDSPPPIFQRSVSSTSADDSSLRFHSDDTSLDDDTGNDQTSLPSPATDIKESFAQLRASIEDILFEQIRRKDDTDRLRDILLIHIRDIEKFRTQEHKC
ncbi:hypothetical protein F511_44551 [Dorcoceras hygrometricum]|uniref:Uncharacterized protein n=1 Tax=Dorcoceras hygrometricum TaxID=472368 RepID=A0A2Z6ZY97_9LAMI|nr:hypothetical protein F511_44551 [Dorcoceras hygrometricum]